MGLGGWSRIAQYLIMICYYRFVRLSPPRIPSLIALSMLTLPLLTGATAASYPVTVTHTSGQTTLRAEPRRVR